MPSPPRPARRAGVAGEPVVVVRGLAAEAVRAADVLEQVVVAANGHPGRGVDVAEGVVGAVDDPEVSGRVVQLEPVERQVFHGLVEVEAPPLLGADHEVGGRARGSAVVERMQIEGVIAVEPAGALHLRHVGQPGDAVGGQGDGAIFLDHDEPRRVGVVDQDRIEVGLVDHRSVDAHLFGKGDSPDVLVARLRHEILVDDIDEVAEDHVVASGLVDDRSDGRPGGDKAEPLPVPAVRHQHHVPRLHDGDGCGDGAPRRGFGARALVVAREVPAVDVEGRARGLVGHGGRFTAGADPGVRGTRSVGARDVLDRPVLARGVPGGGILRDHVTSGRVVDRGVAGRDRVAAVTAGDGHQKKRQRSCDSTDCIHSFHLT